MIGFQKKRISNKKLKELYYDILRPRMIEEKMLVLLRQGRISKWFSGIGQEAIAVGITSTLDDNEFVFTMHRNLGVFTTRQVPLDRLFCQWQGKLPGFTKGRDRSFHFGAPEYHIVGMISHLGPQLSFAGGVGLASNLSKEAKVAVAFTGEGGTSEGDFHEALNVASVWNLPVLFVIENNGYGLSTPTSEQYACENLVDRAKGYGMEGHFIDGNNILEVYEKVDKIVKSMRKDPRPVLLECKTFRMRGHEEASGTKYVPKDLMDFWAEKDPVNTYESYLLGEGIVTEDEITSIRKQIKKEIEENLKIAFDTPNILADRTTEMDDMYASYQSSSSPLANPDQQTDKRMVDAISDGLKESMYQHDNLVLMGQDIAEYGGVFKITDGFVDLFGRDRVRNTPLCESAIVGIALGLSLKGYKSMVEMQFADFVTCGFNQIVNNAAKLHYRWGQQVDTVIRMPTGGGVGAGPFHSQSTEAWFYHVPGLKIVYPSNPRDAKGLLIEAINDPNPVLYFEHKALYRSMTEQVPDEGYSIEIGKAHLHTQGDDLSIITYGMGVHWANNICDELKINADILDLRSLSPIDYDAIHQTVQKTNRVLLLTEDTLTGSIMSDISAYIAENLFEHLDAPLVRVASLDTPFPFAASLEKQFLPLERLKEKLQQLMLY